MTRDDRPASPDPELQALQQKWAPEWRVWRSRDDDELRGWCATRRGRGRELSMTLVEPTARELEKALTMQSERPTLRD